MLGQAFELDALLDVVERKGVLMEADVLGEIKPLRETAAQGYLA